MNSSSFLRINISEKENQHYSFHLSLFLPFFLLFIVLGGLRKSTFSPSNSPLSGFNPTGSLKNVHVPRELREGKEIA
ncbi:hypothetical protein ACET3Z_031269 [Daucus carota]